MLQTTCDMSHVPFPKISVIIPAYNVELSLARCLDSILVQKQKDIEVIVIDDGSTDDTSSICDEYAERDSRIRPFHKSNGGASSARNTGLDMARGEWIVFVDADDYIDGVYFPEHLDNEYDMYVQNWKFTGPEGQTEHLDAQVVSTNKMMAFWQGHFHWDLFRSVCSKFVKKSIIDQFRIRFDTQQRLGEDTLFFMDYISHCRQIRVLDSGIYYYDRKVSGWGNKYKLSLEDVLSYFGSFLKRYGHLPVELPRLADFEYSFFSGFLSDNDKKKNSWRFSKTVIRMKELRMKALDYSVVSRLRVLMLKVISYVTGKYE